MKTINTLVRVMLLCIGIIMMLIFMFRSDIFSNTEILIFAFGCALFARIEAINDKIS